MVLLKNLDHTLPGGWERCESDDSWGIPDSLHKVKWLESFWHTRPNHLLNKQLSPFTDIMSLFVLFSLSAESLSVVSYSIQISPWLTVIDVCILTGFSSSYLTPRSLRSADKALLYYYLMLPFHGYETNYPLILNLLPVLFGLDSKPTFSSPLTSHFLAVLHKTCACGLASCLHCLHLCVYLFISTVQSGFVVDCKWNRDVITVWYS